ncbi:hypothetical protein ACFXC8_13260 [Streptomyces sp. NPDC059441]|uniref:hypothetical protein n=1 Tax=Streptomyces sp. NPDC059441 TaxID=3346829 RepID=UPI0036CD5A05
MITPADPHVEFCHVLIEDRQLGPLPEDLDPALARPAYAKDVRPGDLVVGYFDGSNRRRWAWKAAPGEVCYRALPQRHPAHGRAVSLIGILTACVDIDDEVLIVPAALYPAAYRPGDRVERISVHFEAFNHPYGGRYTHPRQWEQRGTVRTVDDADGTLTVHWDGDTEAFRTTRDLIRPVDPDTITHDRRTYGVTPGDRVRGGGPGTGVLLEIYRPGGHGVEHGRVMWEAAEPGADPVEEARPITQLEPAPVELISQWLALPQD